MQVGRRTGGTTFDGNVADEISGVTDLIRALEELGRTLAAAAAMAGDVPDDCDAPDPNFVAFRLERLMKDFAQHRESLALWERTVAAYAMRQHGYPQRRTARLLGVGVSTMNRWAQSGPGFAPRA